MYGIGYKNINKCLIYNPQGEVIAECTDDSNAKLIVNTLNSFEQYKKMLKRLQFLGNTTNIGGAIYKFCPVCGNANIQGHKKDCELAKLL